MRHLLLLLLVLTNLSLFGQTTFTLNGTIRDASSNETLNGVNVIINEYKPEPLLTHMVFIQYLSLKVITQ